MTMVKSTTRSYLMINCFLIFLLTDMLKEEEEEPEFFFQMIMILTLAGCIYSVGEKKFFHLLM